MNNIDILEEYLDKQDRKYVSEYRLMILNAIETLISENKELKEKIKEINEEYNAEQKHEMENTIPKSKVEEIIHNNKPHIAQEKLQSLLGKE